MARTGKEFKALKAKSFKSSMLDEIVRAGRTSQTLCLSDRAAVMRLSKTYFDRYSLSELRTVGKRLGIDAPCTLSKVELVRNVVDTVWDLQMISDEEPYLVYPDYHAIDGELELELLENNKRGDCIIGTEVTGVFYGSPDGGIIFLNRFEKSLKDAAVIRKLVNFHDLKDGDTVTGRAYYAPSVQFYCLYYIESVNGTAVQDGEGAKRRAPEKPLTSYLRPNQHVRLSSGSDKQLPKLIDAFTPLALGQNLLVSSDGRYRFTQVIPDMAASLMREAKADEVIALVLGDGEYNKLNAERADYIVSTDGSDSMEDARIVARAYRYAVRQAQEGKNIVVILSDIETAALMGPDGAAEFVNSARRYSGAGSVTVITYADRDDPKGQYYRIKNCVSAEFSLCTRPFYGDFTVNLSKSYTLCEPILTKREQVALDAVKRVAKFEGETAAVKAVLGGGSYDDVVETFSSDGER